MLLPYASDHLCDTPSFSLNFCVLQCIVPLNLTTYTLPFQANMTEGDTKGRLLTEVCHGLVTVGVESSVRWRGGATGSTPMLAPGCPHLWTDSQNIRYTLRATGACWWDLGERRSSGC